MALRVMSSINQAILLRLIQRASHLFLRNICLLIRQSVDYNHPLLIWIHNVLPIQRRHKHQARLLWAKLGEDLAKGSATLTGKLNLRGRLNGLGGGSDDRQISGDSDQPEDPHSVTRKL